MKKAYLSLTLFTLLTIAVYAQNLNFTYADPQPDLLDMYGGSFATGDIDGDGDDDLLIGGGPISGVALYLNDGLGNFTEIPSTPLPQLTVLSTMARFVDIDGDNDLDLFFAGMALGIPQFTHIYRNNGQGQFTLITNQSLLPVMVKAFDIRDADGDTDPDLFIAGFDEDQEVLMDIFLNDGNGGFNAAGITAFASGIGATAQLFSGVQMFDADNDGDMDVIICGESDATQPNFTNLYLNDGSNNFVINPNTGFKQLSLGDLDTFDSDKDGDTDILISGTLSTGQPITALYLNDGNGQFTELESTGLQQTFAGKNAAADLDNDGDNDLLITGSQAGGLPNIFNIVYENLGNNQYIPADTLGGEYISDIAASDFNGDGLSDFIIQGFIDKTNLYWNQTITTFTPQFADARSATLYPNPAIDWLHINPNSNQPATINILSANGKLVYSTRSNGSPLRLNLQFPAGLYMVVITTNGQTQTRKLLLQ